MWKNTLIRSDRSDCKRASPCKYMHYFSHWSIAKKVFSAYEEEIILQSETFADNVVTRLAHSCAKQYSNSFWAFRWSRDALALCILICIYKSTDIGIVLTRSKVSCAIFLRGVAYVRPIKTGVFSNNWFRKVSRHNSNAIVGQNRCRRYCELCYTKTFSGSPYGDVYGSS